MKERFVLIVISFSVCLSLILSLYPVTEAADMANSKSDEEIKALRKEMQDLRKDVEDLKTKTIVRQQVPAPEPQEVVVSMNDDPVKGDLNAPVTIIEFSDFQCPYCGRFFKSTLTEIERDYIKTGKVRYVFRDFPLDFHKQAPKASEAANCAGEQGKYWEMHDKLFENQNALMVDKLRQYAAEVGLESGH